MSHFTHPHVCCHYLMARPSLGWADNVEMAVPSPVGDVKTMPSIKYFRADYILTFLLADLGGGRGGGEKEARRVKKYYFLGQTSSYQGVDDQLPPLAWVSDHESVVLIECVFIQHHHYHRRHTTNKTTIITANISNTIFSIITIMIIIILWQCRPSPPATICGRLRRIIPFRLTCLEMWANFSGVELLASVSPSSGRRNTEKKIVLWLRHHKTWNLWKKCTTRCAVTTFSLTCAWAAPF